MKEYKFKVVEVKNNVYDEEIINIEISSEYNIVDIQLVADELNLDQLFIVDKAQKTSDEKILQYSSLSDKLNILSITTIRKFIINVLLELASKNEDFIWFITGLRLVENPDENEGEFKYSDEYYCIKAFCDNMRINGQLSILEIVRDEIDYYSKMFGNFDAVHGISIPQGRMRDVLSVLSLTEPIPTTKRGYFVENLSLNSLLAVLGMATFFFEEIDNGTRLRIVSKTLDRKSIISKIEECIKKFK